MQTTKSSIETMAGPSEWFTGAVYIDTVATPTGQSRLQASSVHFTPGARTAWHTHPNGQTIFVTEGIGLAQRRGRPIEVIRPGDRVFFEPGEDHWHGAAPNRFMTHLAMVEVDDEGNSATWGDHVTDEAGTPSLRVKGVCPVRSPQGQRRADGCVSDGPQMTTLVNSVRPIYGPRPSGSFGGPRSSQAKQCSQHARPQSTTPGDVHSPPLPRQSRR
jgi:quercetin dioxygenase-like cupin family protein